MMNEKKHDDFLFEVLTEELPPKTLFQIGEKLAEFIQADLTKMGLVHQSIVFFATPRRLAILIKDLIAKQPDQMIEKRGPALSAAYDAKGQPTKAALGFANACGASVEQLMTIKNHQGEWVGVKQNVIGKSVFELMPGCIESALKQLPFKKRMRWGNNDMQFVRPAHAVILLYGDQVIDAVILGCSTGHTTRGHRFMAPEWMTIPHAATYETLMKTEGKVIVDFMQRRESIVTQAKSILQQGSVWIESEEFLNEVTGLVEWPVALVGQFEDQYLQVPKEVLISAMQDHQRYFPVMNDKQELLPQFVVISNIESHDKKRVIKGNERVLRARLADAAFFYAADKKEKLATRLEGLKGMVFQAKLGTLFDKAERLSKLAAKLAEKMQVSLEEASRAGLLSKVDLTTQMVGEFPELQGIMGGYYALHDGENENVARAIKTHYLPRFAGDLLPEHKIGQALSIADKLDNLVGAFGMGQIPTGDKDPYALRRAALGVLRILIEKEIDLNLEEMLQEAKQLYQFKFSNDQLLENILSFMQDRLRAWYQEQGVPVDVFAAVMAAENSNPFDMSKRIAAVTSFKSLPEAQSLSSANKRVSNILAQYTEGAGRSTTSDIIVDQLFEYEEEKKLTQEIAAKEAHTKELFRKRQYSEILKSLAELKTPVDDFFDHVMVMTEDQPRRENRIAMLKKLRTLFLQVADIALLQ